MIIPLALRISNAFLVRGERTVLIDSGSPLDRAALPKLLAKHGVAAGEISLVVHTHGHCDHAGCTAQLLREHGAQAAIHPADRPMLTSGNSGHLKPTRPSARIMHPLLPKDFEPAEAALDLHAGMRLDAFGLAAEVLETPGHTAGSVSLVFDDGSAIAGDLLIGGHLGLVRRGVPRLPYFAEDLAQLRDSVRRLVARTSGPIYVGHGGPLEHDAVVRWLEQGGE